MNILYLTKEGTNEDMLVNLDNLDLIEPSPKGGTRLYFYYSNNVVESEYVDAVETIQAIMEKLDEFMEECEGCDGDGGYDCGEPI